MVDNFQLSRNGLLIGDTTPYDVAKEEGITSFSVRDSDDPFPLQWGSIPGSDEVDARRIVLDVEMLDDSTTLTPFRNAFLPSETDLEPLEFKYPEFAEAITVQARVKAVTRTRTVKDALGLTAVHVELVAPDPRLYSSAINQTSVPVFFVGGDALDFTAGSGADLGFDLTAGSGADLGFDFTGLTSSGRVIATNAGNVDTYPTLLFTPDGAGSMTQWSLTNETTGEAATFLTTLSPGQTLTADMAAVATPKTGAPITIGGSAVYSAWQQPRTPLRLAPGDNALRFDVIAGTGGNASCLTSWQNASL